MNRLAWTATVIVALASLTGYWMLTSNLEYRNTMVPRGVPRDISNEDLAKLIDLGVMKPGTSKTANIRVKIHDELPELPGTRFEVEPSFVKARLIPQTSLGQQGNYIMEIEIPDDAPTCVHLRAADHGEVRLITDHPRIPGETLKLRFAVVGEDRHASFP